MAGAWTTAGCPAFAYVAQRHATAVQRICSGSGRMDRLLVDQLAGIWLVAPAERCAAAGNAEMARVHRDVTERIRIIRRLDFTKRARVDATYEEHGKILRAVQRKRGDQAAMLLRAHIETSQAEVRKITLHQVHLARRNGVG